MLDQNEQERGYRLSPTAGAVARTVERSDTTPSSATEGGPSLDSADEPDRRCCPVCEFASTEDDDVYFHLMTAHRKSTISEMLLECYRPAVQSGD